MLILAGGVGLVLVVRERNRPLTAERIQTARALWERNGPADYRMDVRIGGGQEGEHHIEVRGGKVVSMETGGAPAPQHVWKFWSVEGMFTFLETELANSKRPQEAYGVPDASDVVLRAAFDPRTGLPRRFFRSVAGKSLEIDWEVRHFEPLP